MDRLVTILRAHRENVYANFHCGFCVTLILESLRTAFNENIVQNRNIDKATAAVVISRLRISNNGELKEI